MRNVAIAVTLVATAALGACSGTGKEGQVEVDKPVVGVQKDTVAVPTLGTKKDTINTPVVTTKKTEVTVPTVHSASENAKRP